MSNLNDPRVVLAVERTLLAWNRTSLSLIAFGFVLERGGILMQTVAPERVVGVVVGRLFYPDSLAYSASSGECSLS